MNSNISKSFDAQHGLIQQADKSNIATQQPGAPTLGSRAAFVILSVTIITTTLLFASTSTWALAIFQFLAAVTFACWMFDAAARGELVISRNMMQLAPLGLALIGVVQLLPLLPVREAGEALRSVPASDGEIDFLLNGSAQSLSLDAAATKLAVIKTCALLIFFAAALVFIDSPARLRKTVRLITIFGAAAALLGLIQAVASPALIYGFRPTRGAVPFGMFVNADHFSNYMAMALAPALGVLLTGGVEGEKRLLYGFAVGLMGVALVTAGSRGAMVGTVCAVLFLVAITSATKVKRRESSSRASRGGETPEAAQIQTTETQKTEAQSEVAADEDNRIESSRRREVLRRVVPRLGVSIGLLLAIVFGVVLFGGEAGLNKFLGTVNAEDPTSGRLTYWSATLEMIKRRPLLGVGLGAFPVAYTEFDTTSGVYRIEESHNDYLQILSDAGIVGAAFGLLFLYALFRTGFKRLGSADAYRRGVAAGALAGCVAALVHALFDFSLQLAANALLFLVLAVLATQDERVESLTRRRKRKRRTSENAELR